MPHRCQDKTCHPVPLLTLFQETSTVTALTGLTNVPLQGGDGTGASQFAYNPANLTLSIRNADANHDAIVAGSVLLFTLTDTSEAANDGTWELFLQGRLLMLLIGAAATIVFVSAPVLLSDESVSLPAHQDSNNALTIILVFEADATVDEARTYLVQQRQRVCVCSQA